MSKTVPFNGPRTMFRANSFKENQKEAMLQELNQLVKSSLSRRIPVTNDRYKAQAFDCFLYSQDNQYVNNTDI